MRSLRLLVLFCLALSQMTLADMGIVRTHSGQSFKGEIVLDSEHVLIQQGTLSTRIPRDQVASIHYQMDQAEAIGRELSSLAKDDLAGRLRLARLAFNAGEYPLARRIAQQVADLDPNSAEAFDLLTTIRRQIILESRPRPTTQSTFDRPAFLNKRDINAIRQAELQEADAPRLRFRFLNDVRRRFAVMPESNPQVFFNLSAFQQALAIIRDGDPDMPDDVIVGDDPLAVREFRLIQRPILVGCATINCHGSTGGAGNFALFNAPDSEAGTYTNFYLLNRYEREVDTRKVATPFSGTSARYRMIDRQRPGDSLLLQYGLPASVAEVPHPAVNGFRPMFRNQDDPMYRRIAKWIGQTLRPVEIVYNVEYERPLFVRPDENDSAGFADTLPSTQPTTQSTSRPTTLSAPE